MKEEILCEIPGGTDLLAWFEGRVPSFHDAEVVSVLLDRTYGIARIAVHTWEMTENIDKEGYFINRKHVVVSFELRGVTDMSLTGFNHQNIIFSLSIQKLENGSYSLSLEPCYGLSGSIEGRTLRVTLEPGEPPDGLHVQGPTRSRRARPLRPDDVATRRRH
jgi:hypothetical protein